MKKNDGGPAFPTEPMEYMEGYRFKKPYPGMSLRDYFAGQALIGICSTWALTQAPGKSETASMAYEMADFMIQERNRD